MTDEVKIELQILDVDGTPLVCASNMEVVDGKIPEALMLVVGKRFDDGALHALMGVDMLHLPECTECARNAIRSVKEGFEIWAAAPEPENQRRVWRLYDRYDPTKGYEEPAMTSTALAAAITPLVRLMGGRVLMYEVDNEGVWELNDAGQRVRRVDEPPTEALLAESDRLARDADNGRFVGKEIDDDRPRVDSTVCGHTIWLVRSPEDKDGERWPCVLDHGHEGDHAPEDAVAHLARRR